MNTKKLKPITKKLKNLILNRFPEAIMEECIIFERFDFGRSDLESEGLIVININQNTMVGNVNNIFLVSKVDGNYHTQQLKNNQKFEIPSGFVHPEFKDLVELNFKNFNNYLLFNSLNKKLIEKNLSPKKNKI